MDHNTLQAPSADTVKECTLTAIWNISQGNTLPSLCDTSQGFTTTYKHLLMSNLLVIAANKAACVPGYFFLSILTTQFPHREVCRLSSVTTQGTNTFRQLKPSRLFQGFLPSNNSLLLSSPQTRLLQRAHLEGNHTNFLFCFLYHFLRKGQAAGQLLLQIPRTLPQAL